MSLLIVMCPYAEVCLDPVLHAEHSQGGHESPAGRPDRAG